MAAHPPARSARAAPSQEPDGEPPLELRVPRMADAEAQMDHARRLKARLLKDGTEGERRFWQQLAVESYQAVRVFHPGQPALGAEAAFRAGEILRAAGDDAGALAEFDEARRLGRRTPFLARAGLEIGHVHRRAGRLREALSAYREVALELEASAARREQAWTWVGRVRWELDERELAREAWSGVVERALDPFAVLACADELALAWIASEDLEAAAGELARAHQALIGVLLEETERGERLRERWQELSAFRALSEAVAKRARARSERTEEKSGQVSSREVRESLDTEMRMLHR